jgi:hypothetical protein
MSATLPRVRRVPYALLHPRRLLAALGGALAAAAYLWVASVRAVPGVRRRKAAARRAWRKRAGESPGER